MTLEGKGVLSREKKDEDIRFYQYQKTERKAHIFGHDKIFESRSQQQAERAARLQRGTGYEFVTKFLQFFSCHTAKDCC